MPPSASSSTPGNSSGSERKPPAEHLNDLKDMVTAYARQETVDPLKGVGRYLAFGGAGGLLVGIGTLLILTSILRGLQALDVFNDPARFNGGRWSWVPYLLTLVVGGVVIAGCAKAISGSSRSRKQGAKATTKPAKGAVTAAKDAPPAVTTGSATTAEATTTSAVTDSATTTSAVTTSAVIDKGASR